MHDTAQERLGRFRLSFLILAVLSVSLLPRIIRISAPFERDEGAYAYVADVISHGGLPYRDAFDHRPPGIYVIYRLSFLLLGPNTFAPRLIALAFVTAACLLAYHAVRRATSSVHAGIVAMALLALATASPAYWAFGANTEIFLLPFLMAAAYLGMREERGRAASFAAGLAYGAATIIKQVALPIALAHLVVEVFIRVDVKTSRLRRALLFLAGLLLPSALTLLFFLREGIFESFWTAVVSYNQTYVTALPVAEGLRSLGRSAAYIFAIDPCTWLAGCFGIAAVITSGHRGAQRELLLGLLLGAFAGTAAGGRFFPHYYLLMVPYLCVLAGIAAADLRTARYPEYGKRMVTAAAAGALIIAARFFILSDDRLLQTAYGHDLFSRSVPVAEFLRTSCTSRSAYILGSEPQILFYAGSSSPGRFFWLYPLVEPSRRMGEFRRELIGSLQHAPPECLVLVNLEESTGIPQEYVREAIRLLAPAGAPGLDLRGVGSDDFLLPLFGFLQNYQAVAVSFPGSAAIATDRASLTMEALSTPGSIVICRRRDLHAGLHLRDSMRTKRP